MGKIGRLVLATTLGLMLTSTVAVGAVASPRASDRVDAVKNVTVDDNFFSPRQPQIHRGDSIKWTNRGNVTHTTTSNTGLWNRTLNPGATFTRRFNQTGTFRYHCNIHTGMTGTIKVVA